MNFQDNFITNLTSGISAGATTAPLDAIPSIDAPFPLALDATNKNAHFEIVYVSSKTSTNVNFPACTYAHTADEEVRMVLPASFIKEFETAKSGISRQAIINGGFTVNQRAYVSNATLASGAYGHDRWKAGASGGDYTFTQLASSTQITIKSGKSLIQVVEDKNVVGGSYTLSWEGTAQARFGKDSATPSGAYAVSPITITGQTAGTVMSVEFNEGTLGKVNLNVGSVALSFQPKSYDEELRACMRYYEVVHTSNRFTATGSSQISTVNWSCYPKRIIVTPTRGGLGTNVSLYENDMWQLTGGRSSIISLGSGDCYAVNNTLALNAEL